MLKYEAKILENHEIADNFFKMTIFAERISQEASPGQFVHIKVPNDASLLLRRPISINGVNPKDGQLDLVYQVVGKGTQILSNLQPASKLDILGPLGKGFWIPEGTKKIYIVGGGCGVAPIKFIGQMWGNLDITSFLGFRSQSMVYQVDDFRCFSNQVFLSTDDGSIGQKGSIIHLLNHQLLTEKPDLIMACGPIPMLRALQDVVIKYDIPCQISLEERMGCGVGGCMVCSCAVGDSHHWHYKKVCTDGPVFWSKEVFLDEKPGSKC